MGCKQKLWLAKDSDVKNRRILQTITATSVIYIIYEIELVKH